eukprot:m.119428 g.119428  ORF g.119428 m.119428 type:complete len:287 (-) comp9357_c0_seq2:11-871(-)
MTMNAKTKVKVASNKEQAKLRKHQLAEERKKAKASPHVDALIASEQNSSSSSGKRRVGYFKDSYAGFFIEEEPSSTASQQNEDDTSTKDRNSIVFEPGPEVLIPSYPLLPKCKDCNKEFSTSFLRKHFGEIVCDRCKDEHNNGKYSLITKTTAKQDYLLRESELCPETEGGLRFMEKENPTGKSYNKMKLYLRYQVEEKCFTRFKNLQGLEEEHDRRDEDQKDKKLKRHKKKMDKLRKETMTGTWLKEQKPHTHIYLPDDEVYDEQEDEWIKTCKDCGFQVRFEKM